MKVKWKKITAIIAATATMATVFAGCGAQNTQTNSSEASKVEASETQVAESNTLASSETEKEFSYPMDQVTLTSTCYAPGAITNQYETMSDTEFNKELAKRTGVTLEWQHQVGNSDEWFSMFFADGKYTDIIEYAFAVQYPGGLDAVYADGLAIRLNDVIDEYMPNFKAWMEENPILAARIKSANGDIYAIPNISAPGAAVDGVFVRKDMLDALNLPMPTNMDEWHDTLVALKENYGFAPLVSNKNFLEMGGFLNAYCPEIGGERYSYNAETGKVEFTQTTDNYKEFLTTMAQWYDEGLIDKDFLTYDSATIKAKLMNDEAIVTTGYAGSGIQAIMLDAVESKPEMNLTAAPIPAKSKGAEVIYNSASDALGSYYTVITPQCENVEAAARYLDYYWSEEGIMFTNYGIEGVSYTMESGKPMYTDLIYSNPDGTDMTSMLARYTRGYRSFNGINHVDYYGAFYGAVPQAAEATTIWSALGSNEYVVRVGGMTDEESDAIAENSTELNTYVDEMKIKFVIGTEDIETGWEAYVENCKKLGADENAAIYQAVSDRMQQ